MTWISDFDFRVAWFRRPFRQSRMGGSPEQRTLKPVPIEPPIFSIAVISTTTPGQLLCGVTFVMR